MAKDTVEVIAHKIDIHPNRHISTKALILCYIPSNGVLCITDEKEYSDKFECSKVEIPQIIAFLEQCLRDGVSDES